MGDDMDDEIKRLEKELAGSGSDSDGDGAAAAGGGDDDSDAGGGNDMEKLLANWGSGGGSDSDDDDDDDSDDGEEKRSLDIDDNTLDHIVLAASDMDKAIEEFESKCGIKPKLIGSVKGIGVKQARISFEGASFIEIIAPCPKHTGPIGTLLKESGIEGLVPFHYALRNSKCEEMKKDMQKLGYKPDHISMFGAKADGTPKKWEMLYLYGHKMGGMTPFFINWTQADHPCEILPVLGKLNSVKLTIPDGDMLKKLYDEVSPKVIEVSTGSPHFEFSFSCPDGTVKFEADKMVGFRFPGFETESG
jgi:hypothetical protein